MVILLTQTEIAQSRLETIKKAIEKKRHVKLSKFVTLKHKEFMADADLHDAQAWSFCHFLLCYGSQTPGNGTYKVVVSKLVRELKNGVGESGAGGSYILVIPSEDIVIVHRVDTFQRNKQVSPAQFGKLVPRLWVFCVLPSRTRQTFSSAALVFCGRTSRASRTRKTRRIPASDHGAGSEGSGV